MDVKELPTYDVEEVSFEQAVLLLASEEEKLDTVFTRTSEKLLELIAA